MNLIFSLALLWSQLETGSSVQLTETLTGPEGEKLFSAKSTLIFSKIESLGGISVVRFSGKFKTCPTALKNKKINLYLVKELYGFELHPQCRFQIYLESKDLNTQSPFAKN
jgi:hypothetical protein